MYLLDSICKNVGGAFVTHFQRNLPEVVGATYAASGPKVRKSLEALVRTWLMRHVPINPGHIEVTPPL